jgi:hypothetical protein
LSANFAIARAAASTKVLKSLFRPAAAVAVLAEAGVHQVDAAPVLNGLIAVIKVAELAVGMRRFTGHFTSKRLVYAPPSGRLLADIRQAYGGQVYPGAR